MVDVVVEDEPQFEERMEMGDIKNSESRLWGTDEYEPYYLPQLVVGERNQEAMK